MKRIPADHLPENIRGNEPGSMTGRNALARLCETHQKLIDAAGSIGDKAALARKAKPMIDGAIKKANEKIATLDAQYRHADSELRTEITKGHVGPMTAEIRQHFKGLSGTKALSEASRMISGGDRQSIAALLGAPHYLSGLTEDHWLTLWQQATNEFQPKLSAERKAAGDAQLRVMRAVEYFEQAMAKNMRSWETSDDALLATLGKEAAA